MGGLQGVESGWKMSQSMGLECVRVDELQMAVQLLQRTGIWVSRTPELLCTASLHAHVCLDILWQRMNVLW